MSDNRTPVTCWICGKPIPGAKDSGDNWKQVCPGNIDCLMKGLQQSEDRGAKTSKRKS